MFDTGSVWLGLLDGILFALLGFIVAFGFMLAFWIFGLCGGGDVKLLSAVAIWLGLDLNLLRIWLASLIVLFVWTILRLFSHGMSPRRIKKSVDALKHQNRAAAPANPKNPVRVTYSLPIAVATITVLLWVYRYELLLSRQTRDLTLTEPLPMPSLNTTAPKSRRGIAALELLLITPVFLLLITGLVGFADLLIAEQKMDEASGRVADRLDGGVREADAPGARRRPGPGQRPSTRRSPSGSSRTRTKTRPVTRPAPGRVTGTDRTMGSPRPRPSGPATATKTWARRSLGPA